MTRRGRLVLPLVLVLTGWLVVPAGASAQAVPSCASLGTAGLRFAGLKARAPVGEEQRFYVEGTGDLDPVDRFQVAMFDEKGEPFFTGSVGELDELFVGLDWADRFAVVGARGLVRDLEGTTCLAGLLMTVRAIHHAYFPSRCYNARYKPRSVIVACGDGNFQLRRMRWRGWNRTVTRGRGVALTNDCMPFCAAGHFHRTRVRVRLSGRKRCPQVDRYVYTRMHYRLARVPPGGGQRSGYVPWPCRLYDLGS